MDDELARRLDRITVLLVVVLAVQTLMLFAAADVSFVGIVAAFVVLGLLVALFGRLFTGG